MEVAIKPAGVETNTPVDPMVGALPVLLIRTVCAPVCPCVKEPV